jgi:hypothetical protein
MGGARGAYRLKVQFNFLHCSVHDLHLPVRYSAFGSIRPLLCRRKNSRRADLKTAVTILPVQTPFAVIRDGRETAFG